MLLCGMHAQTVLIYPRVSNYLLVVGSRQSG